MLLTFVAPEACAFSCNCFTADKNAHWQAFSSDLLAAFVFFVRYGICYDDFSRCRFAEIKFNVWVYDALRFR